MTANGSSETKQARSRLWLVGVVFLGVLALSIIARTHFIQTRPFAGRLDGQEPESHILVTALALDQTSWKIHHFLPLFNLGAPYDKFIDDHPGAESADAEGNYFYCSTPPLTFVLPYAAFKLFGASPNIAGLRWYNVSLQLLATATLAWLVWLCAKARGMEVERRWLAAALVAVVYLTAPECLKSHSINLWAQQFYASVLILQIIAFLFYPALWLLFLLAFVGCLADWTPYVANVAMAGIALYSWRKNRDARALRMAVALLLGCVVAGLTMIAWFASVMTVHDYFHNLATRSSDRVGSFGRIANLIWRYPNSVGLFGVIGLVLLGLRPWRRFQRTAVARPGPMLPGWDPLLISLLIIGLALLENLLMCDHAFIYTYDRLKGVEFLGLFIVWATLWNRQWLARAFGWCVLAGLVSIGWFYHNYEQPGGWSYVPHSQQERIGAIIVRTASTNGPAFFSGDVKGAEVYYAQRNLVMDGGTNSAQVAAVAQEWCRQHHFSEGTTYELSGHYSIPELGDFPRALKVSRVYATGETKPLGTFTLPESPGDYYFFPYTQHPTWRLLLWQF